LRTRTTLHATSRHFRRLTPKPRELTTMKMKTMNRTTSPYRMLLPLLILAIGSLTTAIGQTTINDGEVVTKAITEITETHTVNSGGELIITGMESEFAQGTTPALTTLADYVVREDGGTVTAVVPSQNAAGNAVWVHLPNSVAGIINNMVGAAGDDGNKRIRFQGTSAAFVGVDIDLGNGFNTIEVGAETLAGAGTIVNVQRMISVVSSVGSFNKVLDHDLSGLTDLVTTLINPLSTDGEVTYSNAPSGFERVEVVPGMASSGYQLAKLDLFSSTPVTETTLRIRKTLGTSNFHADGWSYNSRNLGRIAELAVGAETLTIDVDSLTEAEGGGTSAHRTAATTIDEVTSSVLKTLLITGPGNLVLKGNPPVSLTAIAFDSFQGTLTLEDDWSSLSVAGGMLDGEGRWVAAPVVNMDTGAGYTTIQAAITAATGGDTIVVANGTYNEDLLVNKSVSIRGAGAGDNPAIHTILTNRVRLAGPLVDISFKDFRIERGTAPLMEAHYGNPAFDGVTFEDVEFVFTGVSTNPSTGGRRALTFGHGFPTSIVGNGLLFKNVKFEATDPAEVAAFMLLQASGGGPLTFDSVLVKGSGTYNAINTDSGNNVSVINSKTENGGSFYLSGITGLTVSDNEFTGQGGVFVNGVDGATISGNTFKDIPSGSYPAMNFSAAWGPLQNYNVSFENNTFENVDVTGIRIYNYTSENPDNDFLTMSGNDFSGLSGLVLSNPYQDLTVLANFNYWGDPDPDFSALIAGNATTEIWYTDDTLITLASSLPVENVSQNTFFNTIQAAITAAGEGNTITVATGEYEENLTINVNNLTLVGPYAGTPGHDAGRNPGEAVIQGTVRFSAQHITFDGFTVQAPGLMLQGWGTETWDGVTIQNNRIIMSGSTTLGIWLDYRPLTAGQHVQTAWILDNLLTGNPTQGGMDVLGIEDAVVTGNHIIREGERGAYGIWAIESLNLNMSGNLVKGWATGLLFEGNQNSSVAGNDFEDNNVGLWRGDRRAFQWKWPDPWENLAFQVDAVGCIIAGNTFTDNDVQLRDETRAQHMHPPAPVVNPLDLDAVLADNGNTFDRAVVVRGSPIKVPVIFSSIQDAITAAVEDDTVQVAAGTYPEDVNINKAGLTLQGAGPGQTTIIGPIGGPSMTVKISAANVTVDGFTITRDGNNPTDWNNPLLNNEGGMHIQNVANATVTNNEITGNRTGIDINNSSGHTVRNNVITNNRTGMLLRNATNDLVVTENEITGNWTVGILFLDASNGSNSPVQSALNCQFFNNDISGNWYGQIVDRQTGGSLPAPGANPKNFEKNWLGTTAPWVSTANSTEPGYAAQIPVAFGGTATPPASPQPDILGSASANIDFLPLLASGVDTDVETTAGRGTYGFQGDLDDTIDNGLFTDTVITTPEEFADLFIGSGTKVTVTGTGASLTVAGALGLAPGAILEVINGSLTINGSTFSGSFTFFNSMGSLDFNADVEITASADGLILISDIHVAAGATITVDGTLVIDGCVIDRKDEIDLLTPLGPYTIQVNSGATFTMARTVMIDGILNLAAGDSKVYNNRFENSTVNVDISADGAQVYHNLTDDPAWLVDPDKVAVTEVDGWGDVDVNDPSQFTKNNLALTLNLDGLDDPAKTADVGRTVDAESNVYVRPGDEFLAHVAVSELSDKIATIEMLLGYNKELLSTTGQVSGDDWEVITDFTNSTDASTVIGKLDSALGLKLTLDPLDPDPLAGGTDASDPSVASIQLKALAEAETLFFQRVKLPDDVFGAGDPTFTRERFATGGAATKPFSYLAPFTSNSASIFIDGTPPTIIVSTVDATQVQVNEPTPVDVLDPAPALAPAFVLRNDEPLEIVFEAFDTGLAGLDAPDAFNDLILSATNGTTTLDSWAVLAIEDPLTGVVTYTVTLGIPTDATNGVYTLEANVRDRSGNWSGLTTLGEFEIANELLVNVELQGFVGGDRDVVFVATGGTLKEWTKTVSFDVNGLGAVTLEDVPAGTTHVSAKTAWNLRRKVAASFTPEGVGEADLTGTNKLLGGDLNNDNVVNTLDYSILRFNWFTNNPVADITGSGNVQMTDFLILQDNFYKASDPQ